MLNLIHVVKKLPIPVLGWYVLSFTNPQSTTENNRITFHMKSLHSYQVKTLKLAMAHYVYSQKTGLCPDKTKTLGIFF